jgi:preprotein translocase subunit SecG
LPNWLKRGVGRSRHSRIRLQLDDTPTGQEEYDDFPDQRRLMGYYDEDEAKTRIDALARRLAYVWTAFLMFIVLEQGNGDGTTATIMGKTIQILPKFKLGSSEFIAVFTTTTASVFGFLVIVANYLFKRQGRK